MYSHTTQSISAQAPSAARSYFVIAALVGSALAFLYVIFFTLPSLVRSKHIPIEQAFGFVPPLNVQVIGAYKIDAGYVAELATRDPAQKITIFRQPIAHEAHDMNALNATSILDSMRSKKGLPTRNDQFLKADKALIDYLSAHVDIRRVSITGEELELPIGSQVINGVSFTERDKLHLFLAVQQHLNHNVVILIARKGQSVELNSAAIQEVLRQFRN